jgi:MoaA/NifB/PqqE/SkfB family radical SAM enzyme
MSFLRYRHSPLGTAWKIAKGRIGAAAVPLAVNLILTYRCNLRCSYCGL